MKAPTKSASLKSVAKPKNTAVAVQDVPAVKAARIEIPTSQVKLIFALSAGFCAFPDCPTRTVVAATELDPAAIIGEISHIHSYEDGGPRALATLPIKERNKYANLTLFCPNHHRIVDKHENTYTADQLRDWKAKLEKRIVSATRSLMPQIHFAELDLVTKGLLASLGSRSADYVVIPPQEKMNKNGLSGAIREFILIALAKANVVTGFVDHFSRVDATFADRLRAGFVTKYTEVKAGAESGDELFEEMLAFASAQKTDLKSRAAGLAVLGYFFEACEVFER